jgi:threonine dehydrogenase-like Zn-dependent dehydrogenase
VTVFDRNPRRRACLDGSGTATRSSEELTALGEYDALIEATGDPQALDAMLRHVRPGAALLLLGLPYSRREFNFETVVAHELTIAGSVGSGRRISARPSPRCRTWTCDASLSASFRCATSRRPGTRPARANI